MISIKDIGKVSFAFSVIFFILSARVIIYQIDLANQSAYFKWVIVFAQSLINGLLFISISSKVSLRYAWPRILDNDKFEDRSLTIGKINKPQKFLVFIGFVINMTIFSFMVFELLSFYKNDINVMSIGTTRMISTLSIIVASLLGILYSLTFLKRV